jgi:hypothetical protein
MMLTYGKNWTLVHGVIMGLMCASAGAQSDKILTQAKAKDLIQSGVQVHGCADQTYDFTTVEIAAPAKQKQGGRTYQLYPVHSRFYITCRWGDERMRAQVDMKNDYYLDEFGHWQGTDPGFGGDQSWSNTQSDVRCQAQNLAHLKLDEKGNVVSSTPAKDQSFGFPACMVETKAAD